MDLFSTDTLHRLVQTYGAPMVGLMTGLESVGVPLPAEATLIGAAVYAGTTGHLSIWSVVGAAALGAVIGDNIGYGIGRTLGSKALQRWGSHVGLSGDRLLLGRYLFRHHGGKVVIFGRFVALLRTLSALLAGANHMPWPRFLLCNAIGGVAWASVIGFGAYGMGHGITKVAGPVGIILLVLGVIGAVAGFLFAKRNEAALIAKARAEEAGKPAVGSAGTRSKTL